MSVRAYKRYSKRQVLEIKGFGITLSPLLHKDIEMIRGWRNSEKIRCYALNQEQITKEQQELWFQHLEQQEDEYFIISQDGQKIGLIWFNKDKNHIETGFYIYDTSKQNSLTPYKIVTLFHHYLFEKREFQMLTCKIMHTNTRALRFNLSLGFKAYENKPEYNSYRLSYEAYKKADSKIAKLLKRGTK